MAMRSARRLFTTGAAAAVFVALGAGPAAAHFCYKTELNEHAAKGMGGSKNWFTVASFAEGEFGLCEDGVEHLAAALGATPETLINGHGTMAGGTLRKGEDAGNKAISHLNFGAFEEGLGEAIEICAPA